MTIDSRQLLLLATKLAHCILRGFEKIGEGDAAYAVVQEWRCEALPIVRERAGGLQFRSTDESSPQKPQRRLI